MPRALIGVMLLILSFVTACSTPLPDAQSAGAEVYRVRCSGCHTLYSPPALTAAMWELQVDRMQRELLRRAVNPLTEQERYLILSYLQTHASDAPKSGGATPVPRSVP